MIEIVLAAATLALLLASKPRPSRPSHRRPKPDETAVSLVDHHGQLFLVARGEASVRVVSMDFQHQEQPV